MAANIVQYLFFGYYIMLLVRVVGSWVPQLHMHPIFGFVVYYTDPYLNLFRRVIPPIGGVVDISTILALFALGFIENFVLKLVSWF
jgi:YggT family protein